MSVRQGEPYLPPGVTVYQASQGAWSQPGVDPKAFGLSRDGLKALAVTSGIFAMIFLTMSFAITLWLLFVAVFFMVPSIIACTGLCQAITLDSQGRTVENLCCGCNYCDHVVLTSVGSPLAFLFFILMWFWGPLFFWFLFWLAISITGCSGLCSTQPNKPGAVVVGGAPPVVSMQPAAGGGTA